MWPRVSAAALAAAVAAGLVACGLSGWYELTLRDAVLRLLSGNEPRATAVVVIDESSLRDIGPWPWSRSTIAALVDRAAASGARAVVVDLLLGETRPGDADLAAALSRTRAVLIAALDGEGEWVQPPAPLRDSAALAHSAFELDHDGVLRRFSSTKQSSEISLPALPLAAASAAGSDVTIPAGRALVPSFRVRPSDVPTVRAADLLRAETNPALQDRIVFVGLTAPALGDRVVTPVSPRRYGDAGVLVHAAATEAFVAGGLMRRTPPWMAGVLAGVLVMGVGRRRWVVLLPAVAGVVLLAAGVEIPMVTLTAIAVTAFVGAKLMQASAFARLVARRRAEEVEEKRVLAHELKTPLASVRNLAQLLAGFDLSEEERKRVTGLISTEADKMASMVTSLLTLEKLALRDFASTAETFDVTDLLRRRVELLRVTTKRTIHFERVAVPSPACGRGWSRRAGPGEGPLIRPFAPLRTTFSPAGAGEKALMIRGDAALIERVIDNLVSNALKFSPEDTAVTVRLTKASIEVEDEGPGIPAEEREMIFRRFARGRSAQGTEGLGLGLALVSEIVRWHGGTVTVEAAPNQGSIFRVTFPAAQSNLAEAV